MIASLEKSQLPQYMHSIVKMLLLPEPEYASACADRPDGETSTDYFISFSETDEEISMILPKDIAASLPAGPLKLDANTVWRAVEVLEGSLGFSAPSAPLRAAARLTAPLQPRRGSCSRCRSRWRRRASPSCT